METVGRLDSPFRGLITFPRDQTARGSDREQKRGTSRIVGKRLFSQDHCVFDLIRNCFDSMRSSFQFSLFSECPLNWEGNYVEIGRILLELTRLLVDLSGCKLLTG